MDGVGHQHTVRGDVRGTRRVRLYFIFCVGHGVGVRILYIRLVAHVPCADVHVSQTFYGLL